MSLLEWLGEPLHPGPIGGVEYGRRPRGPRSRLEVLVRGGLAAALLVGVLGAMLSIEDEHAWLRLALLGLYLVVALLCHPRPDTSNLGWFGGLVDHPFRWSDDMNRFLLLVLALLLPGRFLAESLLDLGRLLWEVVTGLCR